MSVENCVFDLNELKNQIFKLQCDVETSNHDIKITLSKLNELLRKHTTKIDQLDGNLENLQAKGTNLEAFVNTNIAKLTELMRKDRAESKFTEF